MYVIIQSHAKQGFQRCEKNHKSLVQNPTPNCYVQFRYLTLIGPLLVFKIAVLFNSSWPEQETEETPTFQDLLLLLTSRSLLQCWSCDKGWDLCGSRGNL